MAEVIQNPDVKNARTLEDALELFSQYPRGCRTGQLIVRSSRAEGVVSMQEGRIIGISMNGMRDVDSALEAFFNITSGEFQFLPVTDNSRLITQQLWIDPIAKLNELRYGLQVPSSQADDPIFELMDSALPAMTEHQMQLLAQLKNFGSDAERVAFLEQSNELKQLQDETSLTPDQLLLLSTYKQLSSYDDRSEFVEENPEFAELMQESWTPAHRAEFEKLRAAYYQLPQVERAIFLQKNNYFADLYKERSWAEEMTKLRAEYRELSTEEERADFFRSNPQFMQAMLSDSKLSPEQKLVLERIANQAKQARDHTFDEHNPLLNDSMVVLRDEDLAAAKAERERLAHLDLAALDAIPTPEDNKLLIASDHFEMAEEEAEKKRRRRFGTEELEEKPPQWWQKVSAEHLTWFMSALIFCGVLAAGNMFLSGHRLTGNQNEDVMAMEDILTTAIKGDLPTVHVDLYSNFVQSQQGGTAGAAAANAGTGAGSMIKMGFQRDYILIDKLIKEGKFAQAASACRSVLHRDLKNARARAALIQALMSLKKWSEARAECIAGMKMAASTEEAHQFEEMLAQIGWVDPKE